MRDTDVLRHIKEICAVRNWSFYKLAERSKVPYSTISNMLRRGTVPTLATLQKLCDGLGISLSDFFDENMDAANSGRREMFLFDRSVRRENKTVFEAYAGGLYRM